MDKREWKPGDVGVTAKGRLALRRHNGPDGWIDSHGAPWSTDRFPTNVRPLVVIDPEEIERLWATLRDGRALQSRDNLQAALREFANPTPPKPDEPLALGAVVEDSEGRLWVRADDEEPEWRRADSYPEWATWDETNAVRVLSKGVTQ